GRAVAVDRSVALLEDDARRQGHEVAGRVAGIEERREDEHALAVDRAAEVGFPLDVEELALAEGRGRGDPAGMAEVLAAELVDREPVHLAHPLAARGNGERALDDRAPVDLGRPRRAVAPG